MVFVVSFSSCLDVAAISMDMGEALDTNNELMTVGISNCKQISLAGIIQSTVSCELFAVLRLLTFAFTPPVVSGLTGGLTGSYIFSQTIFTYRTGCRSRWIGVLVSFVCTCIDEM
jgi:MFS superfamily sulfate permease-like transporter